MQRIQLDNATEQYIRLQLHFGGGESVFWINIRTDFYERHCNQSWTFKTSVLKILTVAVERFRSMVADMSFLRRLSVSLLCLRPDCYWSERSVQVVNWRKGEGNLHSYSLQYARILGWSNSTQVAIEWRWLSTFDSDHFFNFIPRRLHFVPNWVPNLNFSCFHREIIGPKYQNFDFYPQETVPHPCWAPGLNPPAPRGKKTILEKFMCETIPSVDNSHQIIQ